MFTHLVTRLLWYQTRYQGIHVQLNSVSCSSGVLTLDLVLDFQIISFGRWFSCGSKDHVIYGLCSRARPDDGSLYHSFYLTLHFLARIKSRDMCNHTNILHEENSLLFKAGEDYSQLYFCFNSTIVLTIDFIFLQLIVLLCLILWSHKYNAIIKLNNFTSLKAYY